MLACSGRNAISVAWPAVSAKPSSAASVAPLVKILPAPLSTDSPSKLRTSPVSAPMPNGIASDASSVTPPSNERAIRSPPFRPRTSADAAPPAVPPANAWVPTAVFAPNCAAFAVPPKALTPRAPAPPPASMDVICPATPGISVVKNPS